MSEIINEEAKAEELSLDELKEVSGGEVVACNVTNNPYYRDSRIKYWTVYRAIPGNTFWSIASNFRVDFNKLKEVNPQYKRRPKGHDDLRVGDIVYIPQYQWLDI